MREFKDFSVGEWLQFLPLQLALKQARNDLWLAIYKKIRPEKLDQFLRETGKYKGKNIALVVAFEQPWMLDWLLRMAASNLTDTTVLVFDNSRRTTLRTDIENVCRKHNTPYLALPLNPTRHVNRSHGMAMTWIFNNVVQVIKPKLFAFIDHDLIPVQKIAFSERLSNQPFFGFLRVNKMAWNLWAGYCMYNFDHVAQIEMNFLYDFSRGLDTGGRNWNCLYLKHDYSKLRFAIRENIEIKIPSTGESVSVQVIDDSWIHIGGIGYNDNFSTKSELCEILAQTFTDDVTLEKLKVDKCHDIHPLQLEVH